MTNEQYYAFILDNGYNRSQFWTKAGFDFVRGNNMAGTELIGWNALDENARLWALLAPQGDVTVELRGKDGTPGRANAPVLVLPVGGAWTDYFQFDPISRMASLKGHNDQWVPASGEDVLKHPAFTRDKLLHMTDYAGRVYLPDLAAGRRYVLLAWPDGNLEPPLGGNLARGEASRLREPKMPVVSTTWFEADACCRWWGGQLPLECWWEKAARGTDGRLFPWGNDLELTLRLFEGGPPTTPRANFRRNQVMPVGSFPTGASPYGVLDMVGNVAEWVFDSYTLQPLKDERFDAVDPNIAGGPRESRCERGSSTTDDDTQTAKLHNRRRSDPFGFNRDRGFRVAFTAEAALRAASGG
ncbi:MAG: SUMF1/EgtB/PvdO family nonheme iron enzyme [Planctomycetes bacterium]|nr:SUMF1/EgtB/PvdO family nonheme iron enzyme [Planctomycetota bacterium]